ncbi:MAG: methyltransferase domain-containing protein [Pseudomonadota bacterium]
MTSTWEEIYAAGSQLNRFPYSEAVSYFMRRWSKGVPEGFCALDIGCGSGVHSNFFASHGAEVVAFDFSAAAIEAARQMYGKLQIEYLVGSFDMFPRTSDRFDFTFDRLSTTHSTLATVEQLYQRLLPSLKPGASVFWQGYDWENSGRSMGQYDPIRETWDGFTGGVFEHLGPTVFFTEEDVQRVFEGYRVESKRIISDENLMDGYRHSYWMLELSAP